MLQEFVNYAPRVCQLCSIDTRNGNQLMLELPASANDRLLMLLTLIQKSHNPATGQ
jgi:hypothetical protein